MTASGPRGKVPRVREVAEALLEVLKDGGRGALATVVRTAGSVPQQPGARLLLVSDGILELPPPPHPFIN